MVRIVVVGGSVSPDVNWMSKACARVTRKSCSKTLDVPVSVGRNYPEEGHSAMTLAIPAAISATCRAAPMSIVPR